MANNAASPIPTLSWKAGDVEASLQALYGCVEAEAQKLIQWYYNKKKPKALMSWYLRLLAILFTGAGGLVPFAASFGNPDIQLGPFKFPFGQLGYLLLATAAGFILFDRYFGFSTGWMRYITTAMMLERALGEFRLEWARLRARQAGQTPTAEQVDMLIQLCKGFSLTVRTLVEQETQQWVAEFQSNLSQLERSARAQMESARPGAIDITVTNGYEAEEGFTVWLDGKTVQQNVTGAKSELAAVPPGFHTIAVSGTLDKQPARASELVNVSAGTVARVSLTLVKTGPLPVSAQQPLPAIVESPPRSGAE